MIFSPDFALVKTQFISVLWHWYCVTAITFPPLGHGLTWSKLGKVAHFYQKPKVLDLKQLYQQQQQHLLLLYLSGAVIYWN